MNLLQIFRLKSVQQCVVYSYKTISYPSEVSFCLVYHYYLQKHRIRPIRAR